MGVTKKMIVSTQPLIKTIKLIIQVGISSISVILEHNKKHSNLLVSRTLKSQVQSVILNNMFHGHLLSKQRKISIGLVIMVHMDLG